MRIDLAGWAHDAAHTSPSDFLALFERADRLGFDGVWLDERHVQIPPAPYPSPLILAAAVFARTERLRVGASVLALPIQHPLILADAVAQLDRQSGGRIDIGLGRATRSDALDGLGVDAAAPRARFEDAYRVIRQAWTGGLGAPAAITTVQRPHPPLYVAGYIKETIAFAVEESLPLLLSLEPSETGQLALYRDLLRETGKPGALGRSSLARHILVARTRVAAREQLDKLLQHLAVRRRPPPGGMEPAWPHAQPIWGDPRDCFEQIANLADSLGVGALRCVFDGAGLFDGAAALEAMTLFAREVAPALRKIRERRGGG